MTDRRSFSYTTHKERCHEEPSSTVERYRTDRVGLQPSHAAGRDFHVFNTVYAEVARDRPALIARHRPDAVLLFGLAGRTGHVRIEKHAHNVTTRRVPDASGVFHTSADIVADGPWRVPTPFVTGALTERLRRAGLHARLSPSAGEYLCNFAYWLALEAVARRQVGRALFVHGVHGDRLRR